MPEPLSCPKVLVLPFCCPWSWSFSLFSFLITLSQAAGLLFSLKHSKHLLFSCLDQYSCRWPLDTSLASSGSAKTHLARKAKSNHFREIPSPSSPALALFPSRESTPSGVLWIHAFVVCFPGRKQALWVCCLINSSTTEAQDIHQWVSPASNSISSATHTEMHSA